MSTKSVINRDSIYVGQVAYINGVKEHNKQNPCKYSYQINEGDLYALSFAPYRSILFTPDENKFSIDLLYQSPKYPILNMTDKDYFDELRRDKGNYSQNGMVVIRDACNLDELLQRFGYDENLTLDDIKKIRQTIFNKKFLYGNCNQFGLMRKLTPSKTTHVSVLGEPITHYPTLVRNKIMFLFFKMLRQEGFEILNCKSYAENFHMMKFWYAIRNFGDDEILDFLNKGFDINLDAFKPTKNEGKVKKLVR